MSKRIMALLLTVLLLAASGCQSRPQPVPQEEQSEGSEPEESREIEAQSVALTVEPGSNLAPKEVEVKTDRLRLVVAGDLMAHQEQLDDAYDPATGAYSFLHCFAEVKRDLEEGYAIGNLETVFGGPEIGYSDYPCFSTPDAYGGALKANGFDFVSTCNNHSLDKGSAGLLRTLDVLDALDIPHTGTYRSAEEQDRITLVEADGIKIAILAWTFSTNGISMPQGKEYLVNMMTEERVISDLAKARALEPDLIVCLPHNGNEYEEMAKDVFVWWLDLMLYHGADLVFASHPHVLQQMMMRDVVDIDGRERKGFLICSMGNFISAQRYEPREVSVMLKVDLSRKGEEKPVIDQVSFVPTYVQFRDTTGNYHIRVLPIGDVVESLKDGGNPYNLRPQDIDRVYRASNEITTRYLGAAVPREEIAREYVFYARPKTAEEQAEAARPPKEPSLFD